MVLNEDSKALSSHFGADALKIIKFPLFYPFIVDSPLVYTYLSLIPVMILVILITWGFVKIFRLPEKEYKKYESFKQFYGMLLYYFDTVLVSFRHYLSH